MSALYANLRRWLAPPVFFDQTLNLQAGLLNALMLVVSSVWLMALFVQVILQQVLSWRNIALSLVIIALLLILRTVLRLGQVRIVAMLLPLLSFITTTMELINLGTIQSFHLAGYLLAIILAMLLISLRAGLLFALLSIAAVSILARAEVLGQMVLLGVNPLHQLVIFVAMVSFTYAIVASIRKAMFGALAQAQLELTHRQQAEEALQQLNASLDQRVSERTRELEAVIEKQRQTELALRASEEKFRTLIDFTLDWEYWLGPQGDFLYVSPSCELVTGYPASEYLADAGLFEHILHPEDRPLYLAHASQPERKAGPCKNLTFRIITQAGEERWISHVCRPVYSPEGAFLGQRGSHRDVTETQLINFRLQRQNELFTGLHRSTLTFLQYRNISDLLQSLVDHATHLLDAPYCEIVIIEGDELVVRAYSPNQAYLAGDRTRRGQCLLSWQAIDSRQPVVMEEYSTWEHHRAVFDPVTLHAVAELPIIVGEGQQVLGVLGLGRDKANYPFSPDEIQVGTLFTQIAGLAIENTQLQSTLTEQSFRDPLTGLHNRRYLFETLQQEFARARRAETPVSFVLLDIDHFKRLNDRYGHGAGDAVLRALAEKFKSMVRAGDILCRYGGDEHIIVLYNATGDIAMTRAEHWRKAIEAMTVQYHGHVLCFTISVGVAVYPQHGDNIDDVISRADRALYLSKNHGRNQVTLFSDQ